MASDIQLNPKPKVSVLMITYNHEKYIEQAVRSVMMQGTNFEYELVIGEDCSKDRTREILMRLHEEFPNRIRLILHPQNVGIMPNFVTVYNACQGEYIALLEGDDYWTDPNKLQIQSSHLDNNPKCRICWHSRNIVDAEDKPLETPDFLQYDGWGIRENLAITFIRTPTVMFNRPSIQIPDWMNELKAEGDWPLYTWLLLQGGTLCFLNTEPMSTYRVHPEGVTEVTRNPNSQAAERAIQRHLKVFQDVSLVAQHIPLNLRADLRNRQYNTSLALARLLIEKGSYLHALKYIYHAMINALLASGPSSMKLNKIERVKKLTKLILLRR